MSSRESFVELESFAGRGPYGMPAAQSPEPFGPFSMLIRTPPAEAMEVVEFWREAGPARWFAKQADFDGRFRNRFIMLHEAAARGELDGWIATPCGALALVLLLDQFPRNAFRGTPRMYETDATARRVAAAAIGAHRDLLVEKDLQQFFYLPFAHSEKMSDQNLSVALNRRLGKSNLSNSRRHRSIIRRFGRFPHRNPILGRGMRQNEQRFLDEGGFAG